MGHDGVEVRLLVSYVARGIGISSRYLPSYIRPYNVRCFYTNLSLPKSHYLSPGCLPYQIMDREKHLRGVWPGVRVRARAVGGSVLGGLR